MPSNAPSRRPTASTSDTAAATSTSDSSGPDAITTGDVRLNAAVVIGSLSSSPNVRELPSGTVVADLSVATSSSLFRARSIGDGGPLTTVPVSWHSPTKVVHRLAEGTTVLAVGYVSRRFFRAGGQLVSRTELVAQRVIPTSRKSACQKALADFGAEIEVLLAATG